MVVEDLGVHIAAYLAFLVVPILGRMSDPIEVVRQGNDERVHLSCLAILSIHNTLYLESSLAFALTVRLMPLEVGVTNPTGMSPKLIEERAIKREFLEQLLDGSKIKDYAVVPGVKAELRRYQQEGVNWLAFLQKFNLHGVLCDDMVR